MPPILNAQGVTKRFGALPLFQEISFTVSEGDRIGLIGDLDRRPFMDAKHCGVLQRMQVEADDIDGPVF